MTSNILKCFHMQYRAADSHDYWLQASSESDARRLLAINLAEARAAVDPMAFTCVAVTESAMAAPRPGFIRDEQMQEIPIFQV